MKTFVSEGAVHDFDLEGETLISDAAFLSLELWRGSQFLY